MTINSSVEQYFTKFEDQRPVFEGMKTHYLEAVYPVLKDMDKERENTLNSALLAQLFIALLVFLLIVVVLSSGGGAAVIVIIIPTIFFMGLMWSLQTKTFVTDAKSQLIGGVVSFFNWKYFPESEEPAIFKRLSQLKLFTGFDSKNFSDRFEGTAFDHNFELTEILLTRTDTRTTTDANGHTTTEHYTVTVFNGCMISIDVNQKFSGETIVLRRGFLFNPKKVKGLKKVGFSSSQFEKVLRAYGTDQVESRYLLPPTIIEQILAYEKAFKGKNIRFAFIGEKLHIVIETGDRFRFKGVSQSLLADSRIATLLDEIAATFNLIEGMIEKTPEDWKDTFGHHAFHRNDEVL